MTPDSSLHDRVVIITGGSRGFGRFIGEALLAAGARVVLTGAIVTFSPRHRSTLATAEQAHDA
ncbi:MAG: hypothetical protein EA371_03610 [Gammaproteobacteria bacterium]|nr:MAG: hypothetical protein EA371_03610 [Gammaproteobacteria bacterium]